MRKLFLFFSLALLSGAGAAARSLTPSEALGRVTGQAVVHVSRSASAPALVMTVGTDDTPSLYVFNRPEGGWMIVSADDVAAPVIAYNDSGAIDPENLPENFRGWLEESSRQIRMASDSGAEPYAVSRSSDREPIAQMLTTVWDQKAPFNDCCPMVANKRTYTGCVATAMAQVMKYYNWPKQAGENANITYTWRGGPADTPTLSADFSNFRFDWDNMVDSYFAGYTSVQSEAVAKLMQACGYSVEMMYSTVASAAFNEKVGNALVTYFDYDAGLHNEPRELYTTAEWEQMVYDNLKECGPMVYWGTGSVGHCFVCDGYKGDGYFHFNWGWTGNSDGYYLLDALNPAYVGTGGGTGGYNSSQGALFGAKPSDGKPAERRYTFTCSGFANVTVQGTFLTIDGEFKNRSPYNVDGKAVYLIYNEDGTELVTTVGDFTLPSSFSNYGPDSNCYKLMGSIPSTALGEGTYRVYPGIRVDGKDYVFRTPCSEPDYIIYKREKNGSSYTNTATLPSVGEMVVEDLSTNGDFYVGSNIKVSGVARFTGNAESELYLLAALVDSEGNVLTTADGATIKFTPEGKPFEFISSWFRNYTVNPGKHTFALVYMDNFTYEYKIMASCEVTVSPYVYGEYEIKSLDVANSSAVDPMAISLTGTVLGLAGVAEDNYLYFGIKDASDKTILTKNVKLYVTAGNTATLRATVSLPDAKPGEVYTAYFYRERYSFPGGMQPVYELPGVPFTIGSQSGLPGIEADNDLPAKYFNLQGRRVDPSALTPGVYLRRQGSKTVKILVK